MPCVGYVTCSVCISCRCFHDFWISVLCHVHAVNHTVVGADVYMHLCLQLVYVLLRTNRA